MSNKTKKVILSIVAVIGIVGVFFLGFFTRELTYSSNQRAVLSILDKYEKYYYYEDENVVDIISDAIFDKYSTYMTKEEYAKVTSEASGKTQGIGVGFTVGSLKISSVPTNSPCDKAGVKVGGTITKISVNSVDKPFSDYDGFMDIIDGVSLGSKVKLTVDYDGEEKTFEVEKQEYKRSYVTYKDNSGTYNFLDDNGMKLSLRSLDSVELENTAYLKYEQFSGKASGVEGSIGQLKTVLSKFQSDGNKNLILDLRGNGGGYMSILSEVAGFFVEPNGTNQVVSIAKDKNSNLKKYYLKNSLYNSYGFENIIVLADKSTASASEVLIGAMLDYDTKNKVTVVLDGYSSGENTLYKTYGKGIMQTTYANFDGSAVKVTTAELYWPKSGVSIHNKGVTVDTSPKVKNAENGDAYEFAINLLNS